ncbi:thymidine kinase, partial [Sphingomonas sp.]|uniref:thymidine kinase n=1 Tax=Sphingomonas sp. TaxID=28214 RepID=UPI003B3A490D
GLTADAHVFDAATDLRAAIKTEATHAPLHCVLVDEAQFLSARQVGQLAGVCDELHIPVLAYGLRTDFRGALFEGSKGLLAIADVLSEIKAVCGCGRKATMNLRCDGEGRIAREGAQTEIGGNDRYLAACRRHFMEAMRLGRLPDFGHAA